MLDEIYQSIGHSDTDDLLTLTADPLFVYGPRKGDVHASRADALVALKGFVDKQKKREVKSADLAVVASPGGHSAWAFDAIDIDGTALAMIAVLSNADDVWQVSAVDLALTPAMKSVRAEVKQDAVVPPGMAGIAKIDPDAKPAIDKLTKGFADQSILGDDLASRSDAVYAGPGGGDVVRGKSELKKLFKKRVKENVREVAAGDATAAVTGDGQLAWVTLPAVRFEDDVDPLPLRVFAVFEKHDAEWKLIALHESVTIDAPGSATAFKRFTLPVPAAGSAAFGSGSDDAPPPKKKKHKKHKKPPPPPADDDSN
ncbi:MAG TPA: nuclear transport factor 2 family protein [Kofleriaceae bacterium]|nr:nuclear transport factor 2 family protein [Kofleriaceae bacterium]